MSTKHEEMVDQLEEILEKKSRERKTFNESLKRELVANYDDIDDDGTFSGTIHRTWMDIKAFFSGDNDESMLEEAIRGDKSAVEEYEEVLEDATLPASIATLLRTQQIKIRTDLNKIKSLEDLK